MSSNTDEVKIDDKAATETIVNTNQGKFTQLQNPTIHVSDGTPNSGPDVAEGQSGDVDLPSLPIAYLNCNIVYENAGSNATPVSTAENLTEGKEEICLKIKLIQVASNPTGKKDKWEKTIETAESMGITKDPSNKKPRMGERFEENGVTYMYKPLKYYLKSKPKIKNKPAPDARKPHACSRFDRLKWFLKFYPKNEQCKPGMPRIATIWLKILIKGCKSSDPIVVTAALEYFVANRIAAESLVAYLSEESSDDNPNKKVSKDANLMEAWMFRMMNAFSRQSGFKFPKWDNCLLKAIHLMHSFDLKVRESRSGTDGSSAQGANQDMKSPIAILAARTSNLQVFQYALHHLVMKKCRSSSCIEVTDEEQAKLLLISSLEAVNDQSRNALHAIFALPDLSTVNEMLRELAGLLNGSTAHIDKLQQLMSAKDVFAKSPLHYLFDRSWLQDDNLDRVKAVKEKLSSVVDVVNDWNLKEETLLMEDRENMNLLFTLVKNQGCKYVEGLKKLLLNTKKGVEEVKEFDLGSLLCSRQTSLDIAHVFAAYGDLGEMESFVSDFLGNSGNSSQNKFEWCRKPPDVCETAVKSDPSEEESESSDKVLIGWSVIHFACMSGRENNIQLLLEHGYRLNELTEYSKWNGIDLAVIYNNAENIQKAYKDFWVKKRTESKRDSSKKRWWLPSYLTVLDPVSRAFLKSKSGSKADNRLVPMTRQEADKVLQERWLTQWYEDMRNEVLAQNPSNCSHYINCLTQSGRVEVYLFMCLEKDSASLYQCLISSTYWNAATATQSVDDIECSTVHFVLERWSKSKKQNQILSQLPKNGKIVEKNLNCSKFVYKNHSLIGLALLTGRTELTKALLITRQTDLIPTALQTIIEVDKMIQADNSKREMAKDNQNLKGVKDFAYNVLMNALEALCSGTTMNQADLIVHYMLGELYMPGKNESNCKDGFFCPVYLSQYDYVKEEDKDEVEGRPGSNSDKDEGRQESNYRKGIVLDSDTHGLGLNSYRDRTVDFYVRSRGAETVFEEGPMFQHHLRRSSVLHKCDDRRLCRVGIREENELPFYSIVDLASKASISEIFATECFRGVAQTLWKRSIIASRRDPQSKYTWIQKALAPRFIVLYYAVLQCVYLAFLMKHLLGENVYFGWELIVTVVYLVAFLCQEIAEMLKQVNKVGRGIMEYFTDPWNWFDMLTFIFSVVGLALTAALKIDVSTSTLTTAQKTFYIGDATRRDRVYSAKMILGFGFLFSFIKLLNVLRYWSSTGNPLTIFYYIFIRDLVPFASIIAIMILAFGTYFYAILTVGGHFFYRNDTYQSDMEKMSLLDVYARPLLDAFGELDLSVLRRCKDKMLENEPTDLCYYQHGVNIYTYCGVLIFVIIVNLIMFNMLIARFSLTIDKLDKMSEAIWRRNRLRLLFDFSSHWTLPPPMNLLYFIYAGFVALYVRARRRKIRVHEAKRQRGDDENKGTEIQHTLENYLLFQADRFRNMRAKFYRNPVDFYGSITLSVNAPIETKVNVTLKLQEDP